MINLTITGSRVLNLPELNWTLGQAVSCGVIFFGVGLISFFGLICDSFGLSRLFKRKSCKLFVIKNYVRLHVATEAWFWHFTFQKLMFTGIKAWIFVSVGFTLADCQISKTFYAKYRLKFNIITGTYLIFL